MIRTKTRTHARIALPILIVVIALTGFLGSSLLFAESTPQASKGVQNLEAIQSAFRAVAQEVIPAVVEIDVVDVVKQAAPVNPFEFFFGPQGPQGQNQTPGQPPKQQEFRQYGLGSGVLVRRDGNTVYVLTNNHVVGQAEEITVKLSDQREFKAKLVGTDPRKDLALVSFETRDAIPIAKLGNSDNLQVGDWVLAVGNPLGFSSTITSGIVSALGRHAVPGSDLAGFTDYIQTDAAINQGNSGGALVNIYGQVVGINAWIASPSGGNVGLGFAIPINDAKRDIQDLLSKGKVEYGWLGVFIGDLTKELATELNVASAGAGSQGAFVPNVFKGSPADKAGIQPGDVITAVNGNAVENSNQLMRTVGGLAPGDSVRFTVVREGKQMSLTARITARENEQTLAQQGKRIWPGMYVTRLTDDLRKQLNLQSGTGDVVVANVVQGSPAEVAGLRQGDVIQKVNNKSVQNLADFYTDLNQGAKEVNFRILRQGVELTIGLVR
jgi:serine protease Do